MTSRYVTPGTSACTDIRRPLYKLFTCNASKRVTPYILIKVSYAALLVSRGNWRQQRLGIQRNHIIYNAFDYHIIRESSAKFIDIAAIGYRETLWNSYGILILVIVYVIVTRKIFASVANFITFFTDKCRYCDIGSNFIKLQTDTSCQL